MTIAIRLIAHARNVAATSAAGVLSFVIAILLSGQAAAIPATYNFVTGPGNIQGVPIPLGVSGQFDYPGTPTVIAPTPNGSTQYRPAWLNLSGTVGGHSFSDPTGRAMVGNEVTPSAFFKTPVDFFQLLAEPPMGSMPNGHNISGFSIAGYTLVDVRLFWIETILGAPDFLSSNALPKTIPTFEGRLALDFVPNTDLSCVAGANGLCASEQSAFFDGLYASKVPEPGTLAVLTAGLLGFRFLRRRKA